jgi:hypothetical protein
VVENQIGRGQARINAEKSIKELIMPDQLQPIDIVEVFCSYSHKDEEWKDKLETHLSGLRRQQLIALWSDRKIEAGDDWKGQIDEHLNNADIILLLISADFVASRYCYDVEMRRALERHDNKEAKVIPISLRPFDWDGLPFAKLQALPKDAKPITTWANQDEAFVDVARGIREQVVKLKSSTKAPPSPSMVYKTRSFEPMGQWALALNIAADNIDGVALKTMLDSMRAIAGKSKLVLQRIEGNPATLMLSSTRPAFEKIQVQASQIVLPSGIQIAQIEWKSTMRQGSIMR